MHVQSQLYSFLPYFNSNLKKNDNYFISKVWGQHGYFCLYRKHILEAVIFELKSIKSCRMVKRIATFEIIEKY